MGHLRTRPERRLRKGKRRLHWRRRRPHGRPKYSLDHVVYRRTAAVPRRRRLRPPAPTAWPIISVPEGRQLTSNDEPRVAHPEQIHFGKRRLQPNDVRVVKKDALRRAVAGTVAGNVIEWYEFGVIAYLITTMGPVFLPKADPTVQALYLHGTFAITFVARPLGGVFCGWLGDRIGRRKVLTFTLLLNVARYVRDRPSPGLRPDWTMGPRSPGVPEIAAGFLGQRGIYRGRYIPERVRPRSSAWILRRFHGLQLSWLCLWSWSRRRPAGYFGR